MSASKRAKELGIKSLKLAAELSNKTTQTLRNIYKRDPQFFDVIILGCIAKYGQKERGDE